MDTNDIRNNCETKQFYHETFVSKSPFVAEFLLKTVLDITIISRKFQFVNNFG